MLAPKLGSKMVLRPAPKLRRKLQLVQLAASAAPLRSFLSNRRRKRSHGRLDRVQKILSSKKRTLREHIFVGIAPVAHVAALVAHVATLVACVTTLVACVSALVAYVGALVA